MMKHIRLKTKVAATILASVAIAMMSTINTPAATPKTRTEIGTYYNYMYIQTLDGSGWTLPDTQSRGNKYMRWNGAAGCYMPIFKDNQRVIVKFDTKGTKTKRDDRILSVKTIGSGKLMPLIRKIKY